jgi:ABC-type uncharacterized transport system auxiliary subunit
MPGLALAVLLWSAAFLTGCGKSPALINRYVFDYPAPAVPAASPLPVALKMGQFAVAQAFNSTAMIYQEKPQKSDSYQYNRWRVNPGYLVTDYLSRDFRQARLFSAVFAPGSPEPARFRLEGGVEEIQEVDEPTGWQASLTLTVTLLDLQAEDSDRQVVFQKTYRAREPLAQKTPPGLAAAMSQAMARLSQEILAEVYQAARKRLER